MVYPFLLHQQAHEEYISAYEWYETQQEGLGTRFMNSVENTLIQISTHPECFSKRKENFRAAKVKGFPFLIVFQFYPRKQFIHIASIYHGNRNPSKKYRRVKK